MIKLFKFFYQRISARDPIQQIIGNSYKETFHYCSVPEFVGASDWQTYELKGDTLYFKGFNKVVYADGSDKTSQFDKFEEKRVRAK